MNAVAAVIAIVGFLVGFALFALAFAAPGLEILLFGAGLVVTALALMVPISILEKID